MTETNLKLRQKLSTISFDGHGHYDEYSMTKRREILKAVEPFLQNGKLSPTTHEVLKTKDAEIARLRGLLENVSTIFQYGETYGVKLFYAVDGAEHREIILSAIRAELEKVPS